MRSAWSVGVLMIVLGGIGVSGIGGQKPLGPIPWVIAGLLVAGGATMFLQRPFVFWVAIGASGLLAATGVLARLGHPEWALPVPWQLSVVIGLYLCLRAVIARPHMARSPRHSDSPETKPEG
jgi:hypothetical protein